VRKKGRKWGGSRTERGKRGEERARGGKEKEGRGGGTQRRA